MGAWEVDGVVERAQKFAYFNTLAAAAAAVQQYYNTRANKTPSKLLVSKSSLMLGALFACVCVCVAMRHAAAHSL